ncbi:MAG: hypothetical protein BWY52_01302 [Chloroflexi bacterium ADurb.Bin325]|nr:MAG: hypothetical protein BWY52_01302 [Chloroflexi bacterium ADurb.Bin325]
MQRDRVAVERDGDGLVRVGRPVDAAVQRGLDARRAAGQRIDHRQGVGARQRGGPGQVVGAERPVEPVVGVLRPGEVAAVLGVHLHVQGAGDRGDQRLAARGGHRAAGHAQPRRAAVGEPVDVVPFVTPLVGLGVKDHQFARLEAGVPVVDQLDGHQLAQIGDGEAGRVHALQRHAGRQQVVIGQTIEAAIVRANPQRARAAGGRVDGRPRRCRRLRLRCPGDHAKADGDVGMIENSMGDRVVLEGEDADGQQPAAALPLRRPGLHRRLRIEVVSAVDRGVGPIGRRHEGRQVGLSRPSRWAGRRQLGPRRGRDVQRLRQPVCVGRAIAYLPLPLRRQLEQRGPDRQRGRARPIVAAVARRVDPLRVELVGRRLHPQGDRLGRARLGRDGLDLHQQGDEQQPAEQPAQRAGRACKGPPIAGTPDLHLNVPSTRDRTARSRGTAPLPRKRSTGRSAR